MNTNETAAPLHERLQALSIEAANIADAARETTDTMGAALLAGTMGEWAEKVAYALSDAAQQASREGLEDDKLSAAQQRRIARLVASGNVASLHIEYHPFDLPSGYIAVTVRYSPRGHAIYGGISAAGELST